MILNSLRNNRFGLGGGTPQLHHFDSYGADIVSTGEVKANRLNPGGSVKTNKKMNGDRIAANDNVRFAMAA